MSKSPLSRRGVLAAGIGGAGAAGAAAALTALRAPSALAAGAPSPAAVAPAGGTITTAPPPTPPPTVTLSDDVAQVVPANDKTGTQDSYAINWALANAHVVILMPGEFYIDETIAFTEQGQLLTGYLGATQGVGGVPGVGTTINVGSNPFVTGPYGVIAMVSSDTFDRCEIRDLWLNGAGLPAGGDCVNVYGTPDAFALRRVGCSNAPGYGLYVSNSIPNSTGLPIGFFAEDMIVQACGGGGVSLNATDITLINVHAQSNAPAVGGQQGGDGIVIKTGNARLVACRSDLNGRYGFSVGSFNSSMPDLGVGVTMVGCGTEANAVSAVLVQGAGTDLYGPVQMTGCWFSGDGSFGVTATPPASNPAVLAKGNVIVSLTDVVIAAARTGPTGPMYPAYCVQTLGNKYAAPQLVTVVGGMWQTGTDFINDAGPATAGQLTATVGFIGNKPFAKLANTFKNPIT